MIEIRNGYCRTVRTPQESMEILTTGYAMLTNQERQAVKLILDQFEAGKLDLLNMFSMAHYETPPVTIREFLEDDYYMRLSAESLYPTLKDDIIRFVEKGPYMEVVLGGATGVGKTTVATYIACWILYLVSCMRDPQRSFGLAPGSPMYFFCISKNLYLAKVNLFAKVVEKLSQSPYFAENFPWKEKSHMGAPEAHFPKNIIMGTGSVMSDRILGLDVFGALTDETNFMGSSKSKVVHSAKRGSSPSEFDRAEKLYSALSGRLMSRFAKIGRVPVVNVLISSSTTHDSFSARRIKKAKGEPTFTMVTEYANWQVRPSEAVEDVFRVLVGAGPVHSRILEDGEEIPATMLAETGSLVIDVPMSYRVRFEEDLYKAIQDLAGLPTNAVSKFFGRQSAILASIDPEMKHPFDEEVWICGQSGGKLNKTMLAKPMKRRLRNAEVERFWRPRINPDAPRHIHIDTSLSGDCTGFAMGHVSGYVEVEVEDENGEVYTETRPTYIMDIRLQIWPPSGEQIRYTEIRSLIYSLSQLGFVIASVSCDSYQSADMLQILSDRGYDVFVTSMDRTTEAYDKLRDAYYEGRIKGYDYKPLRKELSELDLTPEGKVDHPVGGSKDVSDAEAGVIMGLLRMVGTEFIAPARGSGDGAVEEDLSWVTGRKPAQPVAEFSDPDDGDSLDGFAFLKG